jgi:hypothetical protein
MLNALDRATRQAVERMFVENGYLRRSPTVYTARRGFKEWLHFAVHGRALDVLVNFSAVDDIRDEACHAAEIGRVICMVKDSTGWDGDLDQYPPSNVRMKGGHFDVRFGECSASYRDGKIHLQGAMQRRPITFDLELTPLVVPTPAFNIQLNACPAIHWFVLPKLSATGTVTVGQRVHALESAVAYHDHNWGAFPWGGDFAWEWGAGAPLGGDSPWAMVFVRLTDRRHLSDLTQSVFLWKGSRQHRLFRANELTILHEGLLRSERVFKLPRVMAQVSPGTATDIPKRLLIAGEGNGDHIRGVFEAHDVGQVIIPNDRDLGVTIINEVCGHLHLSGLVHDEPVLLECPAIFEFLSD